MDLQQKQVQQVEVAGADEEVDEPEHAGGTHHGARPAKEPGCRLHHANWQQVQTRGGGDHGIPLQEAALAVGLRLRDVEDLVHVGLPQAPVDGGEEQRREEEGAAHGGRKAVRLNPLHAAAGKRPRVRDGPVRAALGSAGGARGGEEPGREGGGGRRAVRPARCGVARPSDRRKSSQADTSVIKTLFYMRPQ